MTQLNQVPITARPLEDKVSVVLENFTGWLNRYGEESWDHQSFFAGKFGRGAKALYYRSRLLGMGAVAPMIFFEAFAPSLRRCFHHPIRFPIADAHYAMGFEFLYQATGKKAYFDTAIHFLDELKKSRCPEFDEYCWGYPFDWVTRNGTLQEGTPMITSLPYMWEAFERANAVEPRNDWKEILYSMARHACDDIRDFDTIDGVSSCAYHPFDDLGLVVNASAYRAYLLTAASEFFGEERYGEVAERNLNFVLQSQREDGSWFYAMDGVRDFVDHFHTCFVMKALAKIHALSGHPGCLEALSRGIEYYLANLFDEEGMPRPFSRAPRLTVYKNELYDCAECINLCLLLRERFPELENTLEKVVKGVADHWVKPDGSFRSRRLILGWDNVPMHRWAQSQMFRALAFYSSEEKAKLEV